MNADAFNERRRNSSPSVNSLLRLTGSDERSVQHLKENPVQRSPLKTCSHLWFQTDKKRRNTHHPHHFHVEQGDSTKRLVATPTRPPPTHTKFPHLSDFQQKSTRRMKRERNIIPPKRTSTDERNTQTESIKNDCLNDNFFLDECFYEVELLLVFLANLLIRIRHHLTGMSLRKPEFLVSRSSSSHPHQRPLSPQYLPQSSSQSLSSHSSSEEDFFSAEGPLLLEKVHQQQQEEEEQSSAMQIMSGAVAGGGSIRELVAEAGEVVCEWISQRLRESPLPPVPLLPLLLSFALVLFLLLLTNTSPSSTAENANASTNVGLPAVLGLSVSRMLGDQERRLAFGLSVSCTVVVSVGALSVLLHLKSSSSQGPFYWTKFSQPDRVLFPILWTSVLSELLFHSNSPVHTLLLAIAIKLVNFYHHHHPLQYSRPSEPPLTKQELLSSSSKLSSAVFTFFIVLRRLGSYVWPTLPILTHFLGLVGLILGQLCVQKLSCLILPQTVEPRKTCSPPNSVQKNNEWCKKGRDSSLNQLSSGTLTQGSSKCDQVLPIQTIHNNTRQHLLNNSHPFSSLTQQDVQEAPTTRRKAFRLSWIDNNTSTGLSDSAENDGPLFTFPGSVDQREGSLLLPTSAGEGRSGSRSLLKPTSGNIGPPPRAATTKQQVVNKLLWSTSSGTSDPRKKCFHTSSSDHHRYSSLVSNNKSSEGEEEGTERPSSTYQSHPSSAEHFMSVCLEQCNNVTNDKNNSHSIYSSEEIGSGTSRTGKNNIPGKSVSFSRPRSNSLFLKIPDEEGLLCNPSFGPTSYSSTGDIAERPKNGYSWCSPSPPQKQLFQSESQCLVSGLLGSCDRMRRTSLPAALPAQRPSIHHGSSGVDSSLLYEAHGIITEMLLDQTVLPPSVVAGLKALATLLKPTSVPIHCNPRPRPAPLTLSTDPDYTSDVDEIPYTGEKLSSMPKRNSGPGKKGVSVNLLRRMSTSTWTTTTSATGMPTLEPQPHSRRRRSASFRSTMEGTPGSSPTQQCGLMPIIFPDKETGRESQPKGTPVSPAFASFKMGFVGTSGCASGPFSSGHSKNSALQASHKARSFSAFALNASTDSRRRFSQQEFSNSNQNQRKTVCSLHPLSPSDLTHLNALAASTGISTSAGPGIVKSASASVSAAGSNRSSPVGTPLPSPIPSPVPSRDPSPCNYRHNQRRDSATAAGDIPPSRTSLIDSSSSSLSRKSLSPSNSATNLSTPVNPPSQVAASTGHQPPTASSDYSPPKVIFQSTHEETDDGSILVNDGDSLGLLSGKNLPTSSYLDNPDEDCSNASTLGDGPGPPDSSSGHSNSVRLSPVTFTLQEPQDQDQEGLPLEEDYRDAVIITSDEVQFNLPAIASDSYLCRLNEWDYPIFELERSSKTQILSHMCYKVFLETGLFETFRIPIKEFISYFHALELGYRDKPYHNRMHAADVLQGVFYFTTQAIPGFLMIPPDPDTPNADWPGQRPCFNVEEASYGIMGANFPALELMALYTAAAMHDYDHPGRTNAFLVTTHSPHAILYNDRSVLENHHAAAAWGLLLNNEEFNFLKYLDKAEFKRFRFLVIEAILATDLKRHFEILSEFNSKVNEDDSPGIDWSSEEDRLLVMEVCIKLADINGPCKFHDIHVQWTYRIAEEFYEQGDEEVRLGLPISPFMDRYHPQLAKLQESFINHLVAPLCKACAEAGLLPGYWEDDDDDEDEPNEGEATGDEVSIISCPETDNENDESSYSDDIKNDRISKRKIFCVHTKHLQDNHRYWMNVIKEEAKKKEEGIKTESVAISTEDPMETIEEENNTPHSLNRSFSFEKEDSKL